MVELLNNFPPYVAAYRASGIVNKDEYEQLVMTRVNEVAAEWGKINFLVQLETDMENYSLPSFADYLKVSFRHFFKWNRMAIVTDEIWLRKAYEVLNYLVHGEIRGYELKDYEAARQWVSAPLNEDSFAEQEDSKGMQLYTGIPSTTIMTAFSYALSALLKENYTEPVILGKLVQRLFPSVKKKHAQLAGWQMHYLVGFMFANAYPFLLRKMHTKANLKTNLLFGTVSGVMAVLFYKMIFRMHPNTPQLPFNEFYAQLIPAHIVFCMVNAKERPVLST